MVENDNVENQDGFTTAADGDGNDLQAEEMNNQGNNRKNYVPMSLKTLT